MQLDPMADGREQSVLVYFPGFRNSNAKKGAYCYVEKIV